ncbi:mechanosensitive ion channel [Fulvivirga maritima]|uniref:mechanosensitive ion channel family protein n=1 Tax=Fulvivirga maritima TaxID=2904247 RepID=UPI001F3FE876|nr:mechanosensitive ion channel [Fulvivirga maritima]UII24767.1 mechanosensitive ion channel [Fulvivirga maritima]
MEFDFESALDKVLGKLDSWLETLLTMLPNMAVSVLLFVVFMVLAKLAQKLLVRIFERASDNKLLENLFSTMVYYSVLGIGIFIILGILKLDRAVTSLLAGVGVVGLALGFAFQDIAANFVSGIILAFRRPSKIGDVISVKDFMGTVTKTNLRVTVLKTFQGQEVYIPNKDVLQSPIINYTVLGQRRIDLGVGISYGDDLEKVQQVVLDAIKGLDGILRPDDTIFDYYEFGSSSINFNIRFWIEYPDQPGFLAMRNAAVMAIKKAFDENDITIPFPIRTLDFGIKGGEKLSEMPLQMASNETT